MRSRSAFTLIELLVVISIIALLSSVVLSSLNDARAKGRDTQRIQTMQQIRNALELYRLDTGGFSPNLTTSQARGVIVSGSSALSYLSPTYIGSLSGDPAFTSGINRFYFCNRSDLGACSTYGAEDSDNTTYSLRFRTEKSTSLGPSGFYCLTSEGIAPAPSGDICIQK